MWFRKERFSSRSTPRYNAKPVSGRLIVPLEVVIPVISGRIVPSLDELVVAAHPYGGRSVLS